MDSTLEYVKMLADTSSPRSVSVMKAQIYKAFFQDLNDAAALGDYEMQESFASEDFKESLFIAAIIYKDKLCNSMPRYIDIKLLEENKTKIPKVENNINIGISNILSFN